MKNLLISLVVLTLALVISSPAQNLYSFIPGAHSGSVFKNSAGDSTGGSNSLMFQTVMGGKNVALYPDSIRVSCYAATDTIAGKFYFKTYYSGIATNRDSVGVISAKGATTFTVSRDKYAGKDGCDLVWMSNGTGNGTTSTNKLYYRLSFFYTAIK